MAAPKQSPQVNRTTFVVVAIWTVFFVIASVWFGYDEYRNTLRMTRAEATSSFEKDLVYRRWVASHGGVYVPATTETPPNPYLSHLENRDITTSRGQELTLVNPAYMTRQVHELEAAQYGIRGHITSLDPIRPENAPDAWEADVLRSFELGETEVVGLSKIGDKNYLRLMRPLMTEASCLKCHAAQGYVEGDIRGGISVSLPMAPKWASLYRHLAAVITVYFSLWLLGLGLIGFFGIRTSRRVRERDQAEKALRDSEYFFKESQRAAFIGSYQTDFTTGIWESSEVLDRIFGIDETYNRSISSWIELVHPDDREMMDRYLKEEVLAKRVQFDKEYRIIRRSSGEIGWVHGLGEVGFDENGTVISLIGTIQDITELKQKEELLLDRERRYRDLFNHANEGLLIMTMDGQITEVNLAFAEMHGYTVDELKNTNVKELDVFQEKAFEVRADFVRRMEAGEVVRFEVEHYHKNGHIFPLNVTTSIIILDNQPLFLSFHQDITERKRIEKEHDEIAARLRQSQKLEALGQLTGGVAHDFNNYLQVINGYTDLVASQIDTHDPIQDHVTQIAKAGERAATLVSQLLLLSRQQITQATALDLNAVVEDLLNMLRQLIGDHIILQWQPAAKLSMFQADRGMVEQVLMNLCINARDAMPKGGTVTIETRDAVIDESFGTAFPDASPGRYACLEVSDTGHGMDAQTLDHIFDPFFTTKAVGRGTGLGLSTVYGVIKQHGGVISVDSEQDRGTVFNLYWPVLDVEVELVEDVAEVEANRGTETLLYAEDDDPVRELTRTILEDAGYTVVSVNNGEEAVAEFSVRGKEFDMAILDVVMPRMGGREAYEQLRALRPRFKALFASGYSRSEIHGDHVLDDGLSYIRKPFSRDSLLRAVREKLDEGSPS